MLTPCLTAAGVICLAYVLLAIHQPTRRAALLGVRVRATGAMDAPFMDGCAERLLGFLAQVGTSTVLMDNDALYRDAFLERLRQGGATISHSPPRQPWRNPYIERMVQTTKRGILRKILPVGEAGIRAAITTWLDHYHHGRPHQGLGNRLICPLVEPLLTEGRIVIQSQVFGTINTLARVADVAQCQLQTTPHHAVLGQAEAEVKLNNGGGHGSAGWDA